MASPRATIEEALVPSVLPGFVLLSAVVFPADVVSVQLDRPRSVLMVEENPGEDVLVACAYPEVEPVEPAGEASPDKVFRVGVACRVVQRMRMPNDTIQVVLQGVRRVRIVDVVAVDPYHRYRVTPLPPDPPSTPELERLVARCMEHVQELLRLDSGYPAEIGNLLRLNMAGPGRFADLLAINLRLSLAEKRRVAATADVRERLVLVEERLRDAIRRRKLRGELTKEVQSDLERRSRESFLREELREIRRQLGEEAEGAKEIESVRSRVEQEELPSAAREVARDEVQRLSRLAATTSEYLSVKTHLKWLLDLPWTTLRGGKIDLVHARAVLDRNHYGLDDVKERILEFAAVLDREQGAPLQSLCLVGPPGTGKSSLARSIAEATGRDFVRVSMSGVDQEEEVKGTRPTQAGAAPGAIVDALKRAGSRDPVMLIDEIDDVERDEGRDPASALVDVLDSELNGAFTDQYLEVPFDLSRVFFVATAHVAFDIPRSIRDRLEIVTLPGYTREEKFQIARRHLLPRALKRAGFAPDAVVFDDDALRTVVAGYTREAGVRSLERTLGRACRRLALMEATGKKTPRAVGSDVIAELLGPPPFEESPLLAEPAVGVATGLAWTVDGGVVQLIEAIAMGGSGRIVVTGRLGDVMRESADIAYSWVRAHAEDLSIDDKKVQNLDLHVHAPEGGVRKDGPSAGVALATALVSVFSGRPVRPDVAMTGELTLRGRVLDVGGIREKVSAAHRAGIRRVLLPARNKKDVEILTPDLKADMHFEFFDDVSQYLEAALLPAPKGKT